MPITKVPLISPDFGEKYYINPKKIRQLFIEIANKKQDILNGRIKEVLDEFEKKHNGTVSTLSKSEFQKLLDLERKVIYPAIGKKIDPKLYRAVMKYVGMN